jgi:eukaryotic translation initiation factor 2C
MHSGKRHHTRFYPQTLNDADGSNNCKAGTIVDRGVTEARIWDFYLQSHGCLQGSVRSGHYVVIKDEIFRDRPGRPPGHSHAEEVQELVHNMCHLFGRATKAVSLCPPAYYADLLCTRARCHLSDQFEERSAHGSVSSSTQPSSSTSASYAVHPNLQDTMFYI